MPDGMDRPSGDPPVQLGRVTLRAGMMQSRAVADASRHGSMRTRDIQHTTQHITRTLWQMAGCYWVHCAKGYLVAKVSMGGLVVAKVAGWLGALASAALTVTESLLRSRSAYACAFFTSPCGR